MNPIRAGNGRQAVIGAVLLGALLAPPLRNALEAGMATHMLLQFPALVLAGWLLAAGCPATARARLERWNALGITGLVAASLVLALSMVPRLLDLALVDTRIEAIKILALVASGAALRLSWQQAGRVVQGFFLGNLLWMTAVVGLLFQELETRLCNGYRLDQQQLAGEGLVALAVVVGVAWLIRVFQELSKADPADRAAAPDSPAGHRLPSGDSGTQHAGKDRNDGRTRRSLL